MTRTRLMMLSLLAAALPTSCGDNASPGDGGVLDGSLVGDAGPCPPAAYTEDVSSCEPAATDYQPRQMTPGANGWPACISDDNTWHLIGTGLPAAAARSQAFEAMAAKLWSNPSPPSKDDFLSARDAYSVESGLASRIARRQDIAYPEVPGDDKFACQQQGIPETYPDRCAGPAKLKPIVDEAFQRGIGGEHPRIQAERIEAALLWFFHLSLSSEVWTCGFADMSDCDSAIGYYTQVSSRDEPRGLAAIVAAVGRETHHRIYDALLAARCWRDVDRELPAQQQYLGYYSLAQSQLARASLRGEALILRQRIGLIACASDEEQLGHIEFVKVLGALIHHAADLIDAAHAAELRAYTTDPTPDLTAIASAQAAIDAIFACP